MFKDERGRVKPRQVLLLEQQFTLPKGDTVVMKDGVIQTCKRAGIRGEYLCLDRTGNGAGVADLVKHDWSPSIVDVNYSQGASKTKIMQEDSKTAEEDYDRVQTELWFALQRWAEFGFLFIHPQVSMEHLQAQLTQREYRMVGKRKKVESKADYISRATEKRSPDEADSFTLLIMAARRGSGFIPSMMGSDVMPGDDLEDYPHQPFRIDPSNRTDSLDMQ
jgi:hypothetical protein